MTDLCGCMDGPNDPDPSCLDCGGTGTYVSDERLAELCESYSYLVENGRREFNVSDRQHVSIMKALQIARSLAVTEAGCQVALRAGDA